MSTKSRSDTLLGALIFAAVAIASTTIGRERRDDPEPRPRPLAATSRRDDDGRGRTATTPGDIPRRGLWDVLMRVKDDISRTNLSLIAAGVAFYAFLAMPFGFGALVAAYGLIFDPAEVGRQVDAMAGILPEEVIRLLGEQLASLTAKPRTGLGIGFAISFGLALWSARSAMSSLMTALNIVNDEPEKRGFIAFQATALVLTAGAVVSALVSLALIAILPALIDLLPLGRVGKLVASFGRWPILIALVLFGLAAVYRYAPSREKPRWRWVSWGATTAAAIWLIGSIAFSLYVSQFASYDKQYGSLGAVVVLLLWLYLSVFAVLLGAEINAELEHQTARDTTTGSPKPLGARGAKMADTVGAAR